MNVCDFICVCDVMCVYLCTFLRVCVCKLQAKHDRDLAARSANTDALLTATR